MTDRERAAQILAEAVWLRGHGPGMAQALLNHGRLVRLPAGAWVQAEGDDDTGLTVVIEGAVQMYCQAPGGREVLFGQVGPGVALGQTTRFGGGPRLVTLICVEPSVVLLVPDRALGRIAAEQPELWQVVAGLVYLQLRGAIQIAAEAVALPPRQRLASRLAMLARGAELRGEDPVLRLSQQALAEMIGLTRKTVNGYLAGFQAAGLVRLGYGVIMICDTAGLRRVAET